MTVCWSSFDLDAYWLFGLLEGVSGRKFQEMVGDINKRLRGMIVFGIKSSRGDGKGKIDPL